MSHAAVGIDANVRFHAEIPVVAHLGGRHLRIARPRLVLGRGWRINDRRIDQRARAQADALVCQVRVDVRKDRLRQPVPLRHVAEVEECGRQEYGRRPVRSRRNAARLKPSCIAGI